MLDGIQALVAGAGLAGLSAAHALSRRGADRARGRGARSRRRTRPHRARRRRRPCRGWRRVHRSRSTRRFGRSRLAAGAAGARAARRLRLWPCAIGGGRRCGARSRAAWRDLARRLAPDVPPMQRPARPGTATSRPPRAAAVRALAPRGSSPAGARALAEGLRGLYLAEPDDALQPRDRRSARERPATRSIADVTASAAEPARLARARPPASATPRARLHPARGRPRRRPAARRARRTMPAPTGLPPTTSSSRCRRRSSSSARSIPPLPAHRRGARHAEARRGDQGVASLRRARGGGAAAGRAPSVPTSRAAPSGMAARISRPRC